MKPRHKKSSPDSEAPLPIAPRRRTELHETHVLGPETKLLKIASQDCPALANHHIAHVAVADTAAPFEMVRMDLSGTFFFSCFAGRGRILLDGRWQVMKEGDACIAPPHVLLAFHAEPGQRWEISWVRYQQPADQKPVINASSPAMAKFDPLAIRHAVLGLHSELQHQTAPATVRHWVEIIHTYVVRFASPWQTDDRLGHLWEYVSQRLHEPWSLDRLAAHCHLSTEHLRRLCRRELGRSPMHHVIYLRMQHAAKLLTTTEDKIETIAHACGYENPFVFSTTFKKWVGWRPSDYRARKK
jgi:AraC-like DNA-binding protein